MGCLSAQKQHMTASRSLPRITFLHGVFPCESLRLLDCSLESQAIVASALGILHPTLKLLWIFELCASWDEVQESLDHTSLTSFVLVPLAKVLFLASFLCLSLATAHSCYYFIFPTPALFLALKVCGLWRRRGKNLAY